MDVSSKNWSVNGFGSINSIVTLLAKLGITEKDWKIEFNSVARGNSGLEHKFDILLNSMSGNGERIVCMVLGHGISERSTRMSTFYAHSMDVSASRIILFTAEPPSMEEKMLSTSLGVEVYEFSDIRLDSDKKDNHETGINQTEVIVAPTQVRRQKATTGKSRKRYRDRTQIIHEILNSTSSEDGATITKIIFRCNLNYNSARNIIEDMLRKELIALRKGEDERKTYRITKRGSNLLEKLLFYDSLNGSHMHPD